MLQKGVGATELNIWNLLIKTGRSAGMESDEEKEEESDEEIDPLSSALASAEKSKFPADKAINKKIVLWWAKLSSLYVVPFCKTLCGQNTI